MMSAERPLDALLGSLSSSDSPLPQEAIHTRVLELGPEEGDAWVIAMWSDPGELPEIRWQVQRLLEATLLANLSRAAESGEALDRVPSQVRFLAFSTTQDNLATALKPFGFRLDNTFAFEGDALEALRQEGMEMGWPVPEQPISSWTVPLQQPTSDGREGLVTIHKELRERIHKDCWGSNPGAFSRYAGLLMRRELDVDIQPTLKGLDRFEDKVVIHNARNCIRWIPAMLFQALADLIGVTIDQVYGHKVEWALCEPEDNGYGPPPVFRITYADGRETHLSIGMHLLRWCVMPILEGEEVPRLSEWLQSEFRQTLQH